MRPQPCSGTPLRTQPFSASSRTIGARSVKAVWRSSSAAGIVNRRAGAGQREHGQPADLRLVVIHRGRQGCVVHRLCGDKRGNRVAAQIWRAGAFVRNGQRPEPVQRDVLKRQQLAVAPRQRLETAQRADRRLAGFDRAGEHLFGRPELAGGGVRKVTEREVRTVATRRDRQRSKSPTRPDRPEARPRVPGRVAPATAPRRPRLVSADQKR